MRAVTMMTRSELQRFTAKIAYDGLTGCWKWTGALLKGARPGQGGYGIFDAGGRTRTAHKVSYEHFVGSVPEGLMLDHFVCETRRCVNPAHMRPVSARENALRSDGITAANAAKRSCPQGHLYEGDNVWWVDKSGRRHCRACSTARTRAWQAAHGAEYMREYRRRRKPAGERRSG